MSELTSLIRCSHKLLSHVLQGFNGCLLDLQKTHLLLREHVLHCLNDELSVVVLFSFGLVYSSLIIPSCDKFGNLTQEISQPHLLGLQDGLFTGEEWEHVIEGSLDSSKAGEKQVVISTDLLKVIITSLLIYSHTSII